MEPKGKGKQKDGDKDKSKSGMMERRLLKFFTHAIIVYNKIYLCITFIMLVAL